MATVRLHPMFVSLSGNLGGLVHVNRYGSQYVRRHVIPYNPNSPQQRECRSCFADAVAAWQQLVPYKQEQWNAKARLVKRKGYNLFIAEFMREKRAAASPCCNGESIRNASLQDSQSSSTIHNSSSAKQQLRCRYVEGGADTLGRVLADGLPGK